MRIAVVCPNVSSNSLVRTYPIAKVLSRKHDVQVHGFAFGNGVFPPYRDSFEYDTVRARRNPAFWLQVAALARRIEGDVVYAFKPVPSSLWVGLLAARRLGVPLILDVEDWEAGWYWDRQLPDLLKHWAHVERPNALLWTWGSERLVGRCDQVFVVSRFLQRRFGGTLLRHGADTDDFDPGRWTSAKARAAVGLPEGRFAIFTGTPMRNKGLEDFLEALRLHGDPTIRLVIVGSFTHDPAYEALLRRDHGDAIVFVGPRPHDEMPLYLAAADWVVIPQRVSRETVAQVPGKVFEAMAMAKPILATRVGDLPEILEGCAELAEPDSPESLAASLRRLVEDPDRAAGLGRAARARCVADFSWDAMERVLEESLARLR